MPYRSMGHLSLRADLLFYDVSWCLVKRPSCTEHTLGKVSLADEISHNFPEAVVDHVLTMFPLPHISTLPSFK